MSNRRVVKRAVVVSSGALVAGALGMGPAAAAVSGTGTTTDPLSGAVSAGTSAVAGVTSTVNSTVSGTALPKPVKKAVKDVTSTVNKVSGDVKSTVNKLTGHSGSTGGRHKSPTPSHTRPTAPSTSGHRTAAGGHSARHSGRAHDGAGMQVGPITAAPNWTPSQAARIAAGHAPLVAGVAGKAPAVAAQQPIVAVAHHEASLPQVVVHDTALALELQVLAAALVGVVIAGHGYVQRRRIRTTLVSAARRTSEALTVAAPAAQ